MPYIKNSPLKALRYCGNILMVADILVNTWNERKGLMDAYNAWENGNKLDAATHLSSSVTAISINSLLSPVNAALRLVAGGKDIPGIEQNDLTLTGRDIEQSVTAVPEYVGGYFYEWFW